MSRQGPSGNLPPALVPSFGPGAFRRRRIGPNPFPLPVVIPAPIHGVDRSMPVAQQPPLTCTDALNVVTFPSLTDRGGVGKRDGTAKAFPLRLIDASSGHRVTGLMEFRARQDDTKGNGGPPDSWADLGTGLDAAGNCLLVYPDNNTLNVFGQFVNTNGAPSTRFSKWAVLTGSWTSPASSFDTAPAFPNRFLLWDAGDGSGVCLYLAGGRNSAAPYNWVARWNGTTWADLGFGNTGIVGAEIQALAVYNGELYVTGNFTTAGGVAGCAGIARWNPGTNTWAKVAAVGITGSGAFGMALEVYNGKLHLGGDFTAVNGVAATCIAAWDGATWAGLGGGPSNGPGNNYIQCLRAWNNGLTNRLYIGGQFSDFTGNLATGSVNTDHALITAYDSTTGKFHPLQNGLFDTNRQGAARGFGVNSIEIFNDGVSPGLWVAGEFQHASTADGIGHACPNIAKWDGTLWSTISRGLAGGGAQHVRHMIPAGDPTSSNLYATGIFTTKNNRAAPAMAQWDGTNWSPLAGAGHIRPSATFTSALCNATLSGDAAEKLYICVYGSVASTDILYYGCGPAAQSGSRYTLASWDGAVWSELGSWVNTGTHAFGLCTADFGSGINLIATGNFTTPAAKIAKYNGGTWSSLAAAGLTGGGAIGYCVCFDVGRGLLYVGGDFTAANGIANTLNLAKYSGTVYTAMGTGANDIVRAIAMNGTDVIIGGDFTQLNGSGNKRIGKWDGANFATLDQGMGNGSVNCICIYNGSIYIGGSFTLDGDAATVRTRVARFDGTHWQDLGAGCNDTVRAMFVHDDGTGSKLFVAGQFTTAGGVSALGIASWNGTKWGQVEPSTLKGFASLKSGTTMCVTALGAFGGNLVAAGAFHAVGGDIATNIARGDPA